jgi:hypothetical protein
MSSNVRICLESEDGRLHPLFWFRAHGSNELIWSPYGLRLRRSILAYEWPEQRVTPEPRTEQFRYYFNAAERRGVLIDHFTSHVDGTFHIKSADQEPAYVHRLRRLEPLDENASVFLEATAKTDVASDYRVDARNLDGTVLLASPPGAGVNLHFAIAGRRFPLEEQFRHSAQPGETRRRFELGAFAVLVVAYPYWPDVQLAENRFRGTFLTLRFGLASGNDCLKTFFFE